MNNPPPRAFRHGRIARYGGAGGGRPQQRLPDGQPRSATAGPRHGARRSQRSRAGEMRLGLPADAVQRRKAERAARSCP